MYQVELLEEQWLGDENSGSTPLLLSLAVNADSLATVITRFAPCSTQLPIRLNIQVVEDETRTQERLRRGEVGQYSTTSTTKLPCRSPGALDYLACNIHLICGSQRYLQMV